MSDQRSQREVVEAAVVEAVAKVLHDHGPMNGPATERWQDCPNGEIHGVVADKVASTMAVQALLGVADLARTAAAYLASSAEEDMHRDTAWGRALRSTSHDILSALARLPEEVRRG